MPAVADTKGGEEGLASPQTRNPLSAKKNARPFSVAVHSLTRAWDVGKDRDFAEVNQGGGVSENVQSDG